MAMAAVAVGQYLTPGIGDEPLNSYPMAAAFFLCAFGNIINDILDIESDRINHPKRALVSGLISTARAKTLAFFFIAILVLLIFKLNGVGRVIVSVSIILLLWYNFRLKHVAYWGNLAVGLLGSFAFLLGGSTGGIKAMFSLPGSVVPAVFAILMHFGREIIKDIEDRTGDAATGSNTAPIRSGLTGSLVRTWLVFTLLIAASLSVYFQGWFDRLYLLVLILGILIPLVGQLIWLGASPNAQKCRIVSAIIKVQMIVGLIALTIGKKY
jgi:geranylgeranylglycerol-phosphate geranylgeranyltransferase